MKDTMTKYINAERLIESINSYQYGVKSTYDLFGIYPNYFKGKIDACVDIKESIIDSLQQEQRKLGVFVPKWCLENIQDTLRIQYNINSDKTTGETCQDRNIKESLNELQKILNGEELTGMERLEPLKQEQQKVDLEKEINRYCGTKDIRPVPDFMDAVARHFYELGRNSK